MAHSAAAPGAREIRENLPCPASARDGRVLRLRAAGVGRALRCWTDVGEDGQPLYADTSWYYNNPNESPEEYDLWDEADLAGLAYLVNNNMEFFYSSNASGSKIVRLRAPVDMSAHYWEPIGVYRREKVNNAWQTKAGFVGTFDGGNHEISGIVVKRDKENPEKSIYAGFFGYINFNRNDLGLHQPQTSTPESSQSTW